MSAIVLQGEIAHYEFLGRGKPVIFLHTWLGSWRYWISTMQSLSMAYRTYALDLWGFGDSAKNASHYSFDQQVDLLDGFLAQMGINKAALVGHGIGAVVALLYAYRRRQSVDRLMLVGLPNNSPALKARLLNFSSEEFIDWLGNRNIPPGMNGAESAKTDPMAIQMSLTNLLKLNFAWYVQQLEIPCLFVYGQGDRMIKDELTADFFEQPDAVQQIIFEQSGHYPMLDEASKFQRLLNDFLSLSSVAEMQQLELKEEWIRRVR